MSTSSVKSGKSTKSSRASPATKRKERLFPTEENLEKVARITSFFNVQKQQPNNSPAREKNDSDAESNNDTTTTHQIKNPSGSAEEQSDDQMPRDSNAKNVANADSETALNYTEGQPSLAEELGELGIETAPGNYTQTEDARVPQSPAPSSLVSRYSLGGGGIAEAAQQASRAVQEAKTALEDQSVGNVTKEVRELVVDRLHLLQELIFRLADSRARLAIELERTKAREAKCHDMAARRHAQSLQTIIADYKKLDSRIESTHSEIKAVRLIVGSELTVPIDSIQRDIQKLQNSQQQSAASGQSSQKADLNEPLKQLTKEVAALRDEAKVKHNNTIESKRTYAEIVSNPGHTVIIASKDPRHTADEVLKSIEKAVKPRQEGLRIDRCRKARNGKVVIGCKAKEDADKIANSLRSLEFTVEEPKNKNPLVELQNVLSYNSDDEIVESLKKQNPRITQGLYMDTETIRVKYRRRARNPHESHITVEVSPPLWKRLTDQETVYIGLQRIRVQDRSPLVQCSKCLGYGHSRKTCTIEKELCAFCGEEHKRADCSYSNKGIAPKCVNCMRDGRPEGEFGHIAFSSLCPVRCKWDSIARSRITYC